MKVYIVIDIETIDTSIHAVFLNKDDAIKCKETEEWFVIEEHEVIE